MTSQPVRLAVRSCVYLRLVAQAKCSWSSELCGCFGGGVWVRGVVVHSSLTGELLVWRLGQLRDTQSIKVQIRGSNLRNAMLKMTDKCTLSVIEGDYHDNCATYATDYGAAHETTRSIKSSARIACCLNSNTQLNQER